MILSNPEQVAKFSFESNDIYDTIMAELEELAVEEVAFALSSSHNDSERAHANGAAESILRLVDHFKRIKDAATGLRSGD